MSVRRITQRVRGIATQDGAGVKLTRIIGQPALPRLDPFLMLDFFGSEEASDYIEGFPPHPHRGFQTVTYMLTGKMRHKDSVGNEGVIESGGIQWMNAGRGIIHEEMPEQESGLLRGFQLWVNLPASEKLSEPGYQDIQPASVPSAQLGNGNSVKVLAGTINDVSGPVSTQAVAPLFVDFDLKTQDIQAVTVEDGHNGFVYCYDGKLTLCGETIEAGELAVLSDTGDVEISGTGKAILVAGEPIREPVVQYGPFVMNTEQEIRQALMDYQSGNFT